MAKITKLAIFILNKAIYRRYVLGIPRTALSFALGKGENYVENIEDESSSRHYQAADYAILAKSLLWQTHDLLPVDNTPYSDGTLVDKIIFSLGNPYDAKEVLIGMKENHFFNEPKSLEQIYDHLYLTKKENYIEKRKVVQEVVEKLVKEGNLKRSDESYST